MKRKFMKDMNNKIIILIDKIVRW